MHASSPFRRTHRALVATALAALLTGGAADSFAADTPAAQSLFDSAKRLMNAGRYTEACPKLEESERLDSGIGTLFQLAVCYEHVGRTASAWAAFVEVAGRAKAAGQPPREKAARDRAKALEPALPRMMISARGADADAGLEITRDGAPVGSGQWGTALPVDPGEHVVVASAPGRKTWQTTVAVRGDGKVVSVVVPRLEEDAVVPAPLPSPPPRVSAPQPVVVALEPRPSVAMPSAPPTIDSKRGSAQRTTGAVIIGFGIASLATSGAFALASRGANGASGSHCDGNVCDATGVQRRDDARLYGNVATITLGAGAAVFIGGIITYLAAPSAESHAAPTTSRRAQLAPMIAPGVSGLGVGGTF